MILDKGIGLLIYQSRHTVRRAAKFEPSPESRYCKLCKSEILGLSSRVGAVIPCPGAHVCDPQIRTCERNFGM